MQIEQLERTYGDFYVPTFVVKVGDKDLVRDLYLAVSSISVDLKEKAAGRFSFTIASSFDWESREFLATESEDRIDLLELFAFGRPVKVWLGYGDPGKLLVNPEVTGPVPPMLTGLVTEVSTSFSSGGTPELTISGFDGLYPLTVGTNTRNWELRPDSDAVAAVAAERGLSAKVAATRPKKDRIDQKEMTDLAFLDKLAGRNSSTFYMRAGALYFGPRRNTESPVVELHWGQGLLSFSPEANLARQVTEVHVHGAVDGQAVLGIARAGEETGRDSSTESGGDRVVTALSDRPVLSIRAAVHTQAEADERARAILEERAQQFVTGSGESIGIPDIVPDVNVLLGGMGRGFSKAYYVSEATHSIDGSGYRTSFTVQETSV